MRHYQLVVFDWDGTLMDSTGHIVNCMRQAIIDLQMPLLSDSAISHIIGLGLKEAVQTLYPNATETDIHNLAEKYREIWLSSPHETPLFDNARELVHQLAEQDTFLAVATGKSRRGLDKVFKSTGLGDYFHASRCADECHSKPHPQMLEELIDYLGVNAGDTIMIGDTQFDLQMAHNAGAHSLAVTHGAHDENKLKACNPKGMANNLFEVEQWLNQLQL